MTYTRQREAQIQNGELIDADDINAELDAIEAATASLENQITGAATVTGSRTFEGDVTVNGAFNYHIAGNGSGTNDIQITLSTTPSGYQAGMRYVFRVPTLPLTTTTEMLFTIDGLASKNIVNQDGSNVTAGSLRSNQLLEVIYDGTNFVANTLDTPSLSSFMGDAPTVSVDATDSDHDLVVSAGKCADDGLLEEIETTGNLRKQLDAAFAEGADEGAMVAGESLPTSGTVHIWVIKKADGTVDWCANNNASSGLNPTLPTDFVWKRRIASVLTDGSANIIPFTQYNDFFRFHAVQVEKSYGTAGTPTTRTALSISTPEGITVEAHLMVRTVQAIVGYIEPADFEDVAPAASNSGIIHTPSGSTDLSIPHMVQAVDAEVYHRWNSAGALGIKTIGYRDWRDVA